MRLKRKFFGVVFCLFLFPVFVFAGQRVKENNFLYLESFLNKVNQAEYRKDNKALTNEVKKLIYTLHDKDLDNELVKFIFQYAYSVLHKKDMDIYLALVREFVANKFYKNNRVEAKKNLEAFEKELVESLNIKEVEKEFVNPYLSCFVQQQKNRLEQRKK
ncbi:hypothetical protein ACFL5N_00190 [bacterium]